MIHIQDKSRCCGCNACGDICPHHAISFITDNEGFWYPEVDKSLCIECGLCEMICPIVHKADKIQRYEVPYVYGAYSKDEAVRMDSTSGGIHSMLAQAMYKHSAYIAGAIYNPDHTVSHIVDSNPARLPEIRSSKYLQSDAKGIYLEIKKLLKQGNYVLFCGCPCQVHALYNVVGNDVPNLTTCDFICRGVNSPKVFLKYMDMLEKEYGAKATKIKFKNKKWGWHNFSMRVTFANGNEYCKDRYHDLFFIGYLQAGNFTRPSCYKCLFKGFPQKGDITLADFWGIEKIDPSMDQDKGTSLVMINSDKGAALFDSIKNKITWREFSMKDACKENPAMNESLKIEYGNREDFFRDLDLLPFNEVARKYFPLPPSPINKTYIEIKKILRNKLAPLTDLWYYYTKEGRSLKLIRQYLYYNRKCPMVKRGHKGLLRLLQNSVIQLHPSSRFEVGGYVVVGTKQVKGSKMETRILLEQNAMLTIHDNFEIFAGSYIRVIKGGHLILHGGFINENVQITCGATIEIEEGATIGRDVVIRSFDGHYVESEAFQISRPIHIKKNVWIGQGAMILKGVVIGEGSIVSAGAVVTKDVPAHSIVAGVPARIIREGISWHK